MSEQVKTVLTWTFRVIVSLFFMSITVGFVYWLFPYKLFDVIPMWSLMLVYEILWYTKAFLVLRRQGNLDGMRTL